MADLGRTEAYAEFETISGGLSSGNAFNVAGLENVGGAEQQTSAAYDDKEDSSWSLMASDEEAEEEHRKRKSFSAFSKWLWVIVRLAWKHTCSYPVMFALGVITLILLVFVMTFLVSVTNFAPGIVSQLVEVDVGQTDLVFSAGPEVAGKNSLDYSKASSIWNQIDYPYHACRSYFTSRVRLPGRDTRWVAKAVAFDTAQEEVAGIGSSWKLPPVPAKECYVSDSFATALALDVGDTIIVSTSVSDLAEAVTGESFSDDMLEMTLTVGEVVTNFYSKFPADPAQQVGLMIDLDYYQEALRNTEAEEPRIQNALSNINVREFTTNIYLQLPPPRQEYLNPDYARVREGVLKILRVPTYEIDFRQLSTKTPVLESVAEYSFLSLFLSLLVNVALVVFLILAWVILYSLFGYTVDTRNYEVGVLRLVGMGKVGIVELIVAQILLISLPSWSLGLVLAQICFALAIVVLKDFLGSSTSPLLSGNSIAIGTVLGLLVPAIAAVIPLRRAIAYTPTEAFNESHTSKTTVAKVTIKRDTATVPPGILLICTIAVVLGFALYYLFPLALISLNITLLLFIFLLLLVSMLLGFCLIYVNFDRVFTWVLYFLLFFWQSPAVKRVVNSNFVAHRQRNRKTFLMYNLTISLVIYLDIIARSQVLYLAANSAKQYGADFMVRSTSDTDGFPGRSQFEEFANGDDDIAGFTWRTIALRDVGLSNLGKTFFASTALYGILPSYQNTSTSLYTTVDFMHAGGSKWDEYLYSAPGSQSIILQQRIFEELGLERGTNVLLNCYVGDPQPFARMVPSTTFYSLAGFRENRWSGTQPTLVSMTSFLRLSCGTANSILDIPMEALLIKPRSGLSAQEYRQLKQRIVRQSSASLGTTNVLEVQESAEQVEDVSKVLQFGFIGMNIMAMSICCFSLITAMYANYFEQAKEIATLRALGFVTSDIFKATFAESYCLLLSASVLGVISGWVVAYTQSSQNGYFADLPPPFVFPWQAIVVVFILSLSSAIAAALLVCFKGRKEVAATLRRVG